jgi:hypothetical protein
MQRKGARKKEGTDETKAWERRKEIHKRGKQEKKEAIKKERN